MADAAPAPPDAHVANEFYPYMHNTYAHMNRHNFIKMLDSAYALSLTETSPRIPAPAQIKIPLKDHQEALLYEMEQREQALRNGFTCTDNTQLFSRFAILGDSVGAGKSLTVLSYIAHMKGRQLPSPPYIHKSSTPYLYSLWTATQPANTARATLIVIPHQLYRQWADYIKNQTTLTVAYCKTRKFFAEPEKAVAEIRAADAVLVSNTLYQTLHDFATDHSISWERIFVDEVDTIEIPSTRTPFCAEFIWFITATWAPLLSVQNMYITTSTLEYFVSHGDINLDVVHDDFKRHILVPALQNARRNNSLLFEKQWQSINFFKTFLTTHPNRYNLVIRSADTFRDASLALPDYTFEVIRCKATLQHRLVNALLAPRVQEMLHAGDVQGAFRELGVEETAEMTLVDAVMMNHKKELARLEQTYAFKQGLDYATPAAKAAALESLGAKIASLKAQIASFEERVAEIDTQTCSICLDNPVAPVCVPCCKQIMCGACILQWLSTRQVCPMCREPLSVRQLRRITKEKAAPKSVAAAPAAAASTELLRKSDTLLKVIRENPTGKFIVFSRYENPFDGIMTDLQTMGAAVEQVHGNKDMVHGILNRFREGQTRVLLLNLDNFAAGLNLEAATHIILYHGGLTGIERQQIIGRAQRLGRTTPLKVVQLLHENE